MAIKLFNKKVFKKFIVGKSFCPACSPCEEMKILQEKIEGFVLPVIDDEFVFYMNKNDFSMWRAIEEEYEILKKDHTIKDLLLYDNENNQYMLNLIFCDDENDVLAHDNFSCIYNTMSGINNECLGMGTREKRLFLKKQCFNCRLEKTKIEYFENSGKKDEIISR